MSCLDHIPFSAVVGFILVMAGAGVMAGTLYEAVEQTYFSFRTVLPPIPRFSLMNRCIIFSLCGSVSFLAVTVLIFGCLVTSSTHRKDYQHEEPCLVDGQCSTIFFMLITFLGQAIWLGILLVLIGPTLAWLMIRSVCSAQSALHSQFKFDWRHYGMRLETRSSGLELTEQPRDESSYQHVCQVTSYVGPLFACSFGGSIGVFVGLIFLLASLSAYYTKLRLTSELREWRRDFDMFSQSQISHHLLTLSQSQQRSPGGVGLPQFYQPQQQPANGTVAMSMAHQQAQQLSSASISPGQHQQNQQQQQFYFANSTPNYYPNGLEFSSGTQRFGNNSPSTGLGAATLNGQASTEKTGLLASSS